MRIAIANAKGRALDIEDTDSDESSTHSLDFKPYCVDICNGLIAVGGGNGLHVATGSLQIYECESFDQIASFKLPTEVYCVCFASEDRLIAGLANSGECCPLLSSNELLISHNTGNILIFSCLDGVWTQIQCIDAFPGCSVYNIVMSVDRETFWCVGNKESIHQYNQDGSLLLLSISYLHFIMLILGVLCADIQTSSSGIRIDISVGGIIAAGLLNGHVAILSPNEPGVLKNFQWHGDTVSTLAFSEDGCVLYSGAYSKHVHAHDTTTWECLWNVDFQTNPSFIVPYADKIAVGIEKSSVAILNASNGEVMNKLTKMRDWIPIACLIPGEIDEISWYCKFIWNLDDAGAKFKFAE